MTTSLDERALALQSAVAGQWSIEREIGRGGMGTVYLARDVALDRPVAIKLLHADLAADAAERQRFLAEARTAARLAHPHIVPIYDVGTRAELVWFVMGYVDGETAGQRLRREGPLPPADVERLAREIGWALSAAHAHGVLHRDVTIENILLERQTGRALLVDFGIAASLENTDGIALVGSPEYIAPELLQGVPPSPASDLYALGVSLWTLLAGRVPFTGATITDILLAHVRDPAPSIESAAPGTPRPLRRAVEAALAKDPAARPANGEAWLAALSRADVATDWLDTPLARWLHHGRSVRPFYALAASLTGMVVAAGVGANAFNGWPSVELLAVFFGTAAVIHLGSTARTIRNVGRAGYRPADMRVALDAELIRRDRRGIVPASLLGRVVRDLTWLAALGIVALTAVLAMDLVRLNSIGPGWWALFWIVYDTFEWLWIAFWTGLAFGFLIPALRDHPRSLSWRVRQRVWGSSIGRVVFRIATVGVSRRHAPDSTLHRPTEMMLGLGIEEMHAAMPTPQRKALSDLPRVAARLQRRIGELREVLRTVEEHGPVAEPETIALRDRLASQQQDALTALERLRRELARLTQQGGITGPLTERLQAARQAEATLLTELGAARGIRRLLGGGTTGATPPTPATAG